MVERLYVACAVLGYSFVAAMRTEVLAIVGALTLVGLESCGPRLGVEVALLRGDSIEIVGIANDARFVDETEQTVVLEHAGITRMLGDGCRLRLPAECRELLYNFSDVCVGEIVVLSEAICFRELVFVSCDAGVRIRLSGCARRASRLVTRPGGCVEGSEGSRVCESESGWMWLESNKSIWGQSRGR